MWSSHSSVTIISLRINNVVMSLVFVFCFLQCVDLCMHVYVGVVVGG